MTGRHGLRGGQDGGHCQSRAAAAQEGDWNIPPGATDGCAAVLASWRREVVVDSGSTITWAKSTFEAFGHRSAVTIPKRLQLIEDPPCKAAEDRQRLYA
jgi:hypothetical protein